MQLTYVVFIALICNHRKNVDSRFTYSLTTLNQTHSETKKRQEIGRGVRLAVNQSGERIREPRINILTVIANQSYEHYVSQLQEEIVNEYGIDVDLPPKPANARKRVEIKLIKESVLKPEFKELWDRIKEKTKYSVEINSNSLIYECTKAIDGIDFHSPTVVIDKALIDMNEEGSLEALHISSAKTFVDLAGRYPLPNLAEMISYLLENTTPPVKLTRLTILKIFKNVKNKKAAIDNPFEFASVSARIIRDVIADFLVKGVKYEKISEYYEMTRLEDTIESWEDFVIPVERSVYDHVAYDSEIEKKFVEEMERTKQIRTYIKLPAWFKIRTPVGGYNPDWAIVWENRDIFGRTNGKPLLYLVRETKGTSHIKSRNPADCT